jgi:tetratricopeptide (TPR) repeat protein
MVSRVVALLGLAAFNRGSHSEAVALLEEAVEGATMTPLLRPDVYIALGRSYQAMARLKDAIRLFERCLKRANSREPADVAIYARYALWLGYALTDAGQLDRARAVVGEAIERSQEAPDQHRQAFLYWSLGRIAAMEGEVAAGLDYMAQAISLLKATENTHELARAHLAYGCMLNLAGRHQEATDPLAYAARLFETGGDSQDLGIVRSEQAKIAMHLNQSKDAKRLALEAIDLLDESPLMQGGALWAYAWARAREDAPDEAAMIYEEAVDHLVDAHELQDAVSACRQWADSLRRAGREKSAFAVLDRAVLLERRAESAQVHS